MYAFGLIGAYVISYAIGGLREFFVLVLGMDVKRMSILYGILQAWNVLNEVLISYLMDKEILNRWFSKKYWGRRAPWMVTQIPLGFATIIFAYLFKVMDLVDGEANGIYVLYFVTTFCAYWVASSTFCAWTAAQIELFPYKEERMEVEGISTAVALLGVLMYRASIYTSKCCCN
jgi:hypothetical protein